MSVLTLKEYDLKIGDGEKMVVMAGLNVLEDEGLRNGIKTFSNWPTIPQLYIKGEFVGGCDIIREMFEEGELRPLLEEKGIALAE